MSKEGPIGPTLAKLTVPMIFGILSMIVHNISYLVTGAAAWWVIERVLDKHGA